jgi:hypothetical protein
VFDNQPLGLSARAIRFVTRAADGSLRIAERASRTFLPETRFYYVDPRVSTFPHSKPDKPERVEGAVGVVAKLLEMAESAQSAELLNVFEREPEIRDRLVMTSRRFRHVSSTFSGLIERSFREFDFYLGMYDAARTASEGKLGTSGPLPEAVYPTQSAATRMGWRPFHCLRAIFDGNGKPQEKCGGAELANFRILAQVTLDRQYQLCRTAPADHPDCRDQVWKRRVPGVRHVADEDRLPLEGESDLDHLLRLLAAYGFHFRDLGLDPEDGDQAPYRLARLAQDMVSHLSAVQPSNGLPLGVISRIGVDVAVGYVPPQHIFHMSLGLGAELGYSLGIAHPDWSWLRFTTALELDGFSSLLNSDDNYLALRPKLGLEFEVLSGAYAQIRLGARGGYQFSTGDSFLRDDCDFAREGEVPCSRVMTEAYFASSLLGLIRLHVAGVYMPPMAEGQDALFGVRPMVGIQLNSPF